MTSPNRGGTKRLAAHLAVWQPRLDAYARWLAPRLPFAVLVFFAVQIVIRFLISSNLEIDEAQFVGATGFDLGFKGSHPPLYNWLVTLALELSGGNWVLSVALVKNALLAGHFILAWDLLRRLKADPLAGLMGASALALLPQIIWQGQVTLAHSVAVGFAVLAVLHALRLWLIRPNVAHALWLGVAMAIGILTKYNFLLFLAALGAALAASPALCIRLDRRTGALALALAALLTLPHGVWALTHAGQTVERMGKLYSERNQIVGLDIPLFGLDGLISLGLAVLAWAGPLVLVWFALFWKDKPRLRPDTSEGWDFSADFAKLCGRAALIGVAALAVLVFFADMHKVHERYLTPLLMPAVIWLTLRYPVAHKRHAPGLLAALASGLFLASMIAIPAMVAFGPSRLAYPYAAIADGIAGVDVVPTDILARQQDLAANVALRLPDGALWSAPSDRRAVIIWRSTKLPPPQLLDRLDGYQADGPVIEHAHPYANFSRRRVVLYSQGFRQTPNP